MTRRVKTIWTGLMFVLALTTLQAIVMADPIEIRFWDTSSYRIEGLRPLFEDFNASHPDIHAVIEEKSSDADSVLPAVAAGVGPNVIIGSSSDDRDYFDQGVLANLTPYIERDRFDTSDYFPSTLEFGQLPSGDLFSLPLDSQIIVMYYNPGVLGANGLAEPKQGWTNDDFRNMTAKVRKYDANGNLAVHGAIGRHPNHVGMYFMGQTRGYVVNLEKGIESTVDTPAFREAYQFIDELINEDRLRVQGIHEGVSMDQFVNGKAGFYFDGNFRLLDLTQSMESLRTAPLLKADSGREPGAYLWTRTLALVKSGDAKADEAAWQLIRYLSTTDGLARYGVGSRLLTVRRSVVTHPLYADFINKFKGNVDVMSTQYLPAGSGKTEMAAPRASDIRGSWGKLQAAFMRGEIPLSHFIEQLDQQVTAVVNEIKEESKE